VSDRPSLIRRAALRVVADGGVRALTHRAVDRTAGLPLGSTANVFSTRDALMSAVVAEFERQDVAMLDAALGAEQADAAVAESARAVRAGPTADALAEAIASFAATATTEPTATLTRARLALMLAEPEAMHASHRRVLDRLTAMLAAAGVVEPDRVAELVADLLDGTLLHRLTVQREHPFDVARFRATLRHLLGDPAAPLG
jgi:DNA-binding transcriptional regulator YbjK